MNLVINGAEAIREQRGTVLVPTEDPGRGRPLHREDFAGEVCSRTYVALEVHEIRFRNDGGGEDKNLRPLLHHEFTADWVSRPFWNECGVTKEAFGCIAHSVKAEYFFRRQR